MTNPESIQETMNKQLEIASQLCEYYTNLSAQRGEKYSYLVHTYGCQLNEADSEKIEGSLHSIGLSQSTNENPDILILNTCAIRENAEDRLFGNLGHWKTVKDANPKMIIVICGCMMKQDDNVSKIKKSYPFVDIVLGPQDIHRLPEYIHFRIFGKKKKYEVSSEDFILDDFGVPVLRKRKFRALVPIMYGCNNFCTYCVVPYTRGRERSRSFESIMTELSDLGALGYKEILFLGQNVNSYGNDLTGSPDFSELLKETANMKLFPRIRFMTSHPKDLSDKVIDVISSYPSIERHLHLPVQSGSNQILERMNRKYTRESFINTAMQYRRKMPEATISTDIIVGFPGETEADFEDTLDLMRTVRFDSAFTFQFSPRPGTEASQYPGQVDADTVTERFSRLLSMQNEHSQASNLSVIGSSDIVLIEGESHTSADVFTGRTSSNRLVNFTIPADSMLNGSPVLSKEGMSIGESIEGEFAMIKLDHAKTFSIEGRLERFINE
jgi:tRNA-2-methylthio-N6-dimethylallyladenosine synthase